MWRTRESIFPASPNNTSEAHFIGPRGPTNPKGSNTLRVAVLDSDKRPLAPTTPRRAKMLLASGKAAVFRRYPFTLILKRRPQCAEAPGLQLSIDLECRSTRLTITDTRSGEKIFAAEIEHRSEQIKARLEVRRAVRRSRRQRKTRYRKPRFLNRTRSSSWLPPSIESRIENTLTWVRRLARAYPVSSLLIEHEAPAAEKFGAQLIARLATVGLRIEIGACSCCSRLNNPFLNRRRAERPRPRWTDGERANGVSRISTRRREKRPRFTDSGLLKIRAVGHNSRQACRMDKSGFPRTKARSVRQVEGLRSGDLVRAVVPSGKKAGRYLGQAVIRSGGLIDLMTANGLVQGVKRGCCRRLHAADGYEYSFAAQASPAADNRAIAYAPRRERAIAGARS